MLLREHANLNDRMALSFILIFIRFSPGIFFSEGSFEGLKIEPLNHSFLSEMSSASFSFFIPNSKIRCKTDDQFEAITYTAR
jgi:hypothetical protein